MRNIATEPRLFILSGGGTGGHVYPAVAIAEALLRRWPMVRPVFVGVAGRAEEAIVPALGYELRTVPAVGMPRLSDLPGQFRFLRALRAGISSARAIIDDLRPDAVVGTGGFASAPVLLAAVGALLPRRRRGRPATLVHEQNAVPGKLNRLVGRRVDRVAATFAESLRFFPRGRGVHVGYPVRGAVGSVDRAAARSRLGFPPDAFVVLVFGGSGGSRSINRGVARALPALLAREGLHVLHGTGRYSGADYSPAEDTAAIVDSLALPPARRSLYRAVEYLDPIADAYAAADVVVCRAGAGTLAEVQACGLPAVVVPKSGLPGDHQTANAGALAEAGAARVLRERPERDPRAGEIFGVDHERLAREILDLADDVEARRRMSEKARSLHVPGAADRIVDEIAALLFGVDHSAGLARSPTG